jgi:hypothetical protein
MIYQYLWNTYFFINDNTCGSWMMGHRIVRQRVNSGQDAEAQSTGLHDPLTLSSGFLAVAHLKTSEHLTQINDFDVLQ